MSGPADIGRFPDWLTSTGKAAILVIVGVASALGITKFTSSTQALYTGTAATGQVIYAKPTADNQFVKLGGTDYRVRGSGVDAGVLPDGAVAIGCGGDACSSPASMAATANATIAANSNSTVTPTGRDGGIGYYAAKDAGRAANVAIVSTWSATGMQGGADPIASTYGANNDVTVDNAFDPSASGLTGPIGCKAQTYDGTKWWIKYGTGATQWMAMHKVDHTLNPAALIIDSSATIQPATDRAGEYQVPAATFTTNRTTTLGVTGPPRTGAFLFLVRRDLTAYTWAIVNGGGGAGTLATFPANLSGPLGAWFYFNGTDWSFVGWAELLR